MEFLTTGGAMESHFCEFVMMFIAHTRRCVCVYIRTSQPATGFTPLCR